AQEYARDPTPERGAALSAKGRHWLWLGDFLRGVETSGQAPPAAEAGQPGAAATGGPNPGAPPPHPVSTSAATPDRPAAGWIAGVVERNMQGIGRFVGQRLLGDGGAAELGIRALGWLGYIVFSLFLVLFF